MDGYNIIDSSNTSSGLSVWGVGLAFLIVVVLLWLVYNVCSLFSIEGTSLFGMDDDYNLYYSNDNNKDKEEEEEEKRERGEYYECSRNNFWPFFTSILDTSTDIIEKYPSFDSKKYPLKRNISVCFASWNMNGKYPPKSLSGWLPKAKHDIYVIVLQECNYKPRLSYVSRYSVQKRSCQADMCMKIKAAIQESAEKGQKESSVKYREVKTYSFSLNNNKKERKKKRVIVGDNDGCCMIVLVKKKYYSMINQIETITQPLSVENDIYSGGLVALSFNFGDTSLCFASCHFPQEELSAHERNYLTAHLLEQASSRIGEKDLSCTQKFDFFFLEGEMNYGSALDESTAMDLINREKWEELHNADLLHINIKSGELLNNMKEHLSSYLFPPTAKYTNVMCYEEEKEEEEEEEEDKEIDDDDDDDIQCVWEYDMNITPYYNSRILSSSLPECKLNLLSLTSPSMEIFPPSVFRPITAEFSIEAVMPPPPRDDDWKTTTDFPLSIQFFSLKTIGISLPREEFECNKRRKRSSSSSEEKNTTAVINKQETNNNNNNNMYISFHTPSLLRKPTTQVQYNSNPNTEWPQYQIPRIQMEVNSSEHVKYMLLGVFGRRLCCSDVFFGQAAISLREPLDSCTSLVFSSVVYRHGIPNGIITGEIQVDWTSESNKPTKEEEEEEEKDS